jgi:2-hydroxychromene-2-carboxylate isomerase
MSHCALDEARWTILLDIRHPLAMLALRPAIALEREMEVAANWLPVVSQPLKPPTRPAAGDDRGVRHRRFRALAIAREIEVYADAQGLVVDDYYRDGDTAAFNLAWHWLRATQPDRLTSFLVDAFDRYWRCDFDPGNEAEVASLLEARGGDAEGFRSWCSDSGVAIAAAVADELRERGLSRVPGYVVEDEVFVGRQHLPMIRWLLAGRIGPGPI